MSGTNWGMFVITVLGSELRRGLVGDKAGPVGMMGRGVARLTAAVQ